MDNTKTEPNTAVMVFSIMDFVVAGLVMITSIIWFRSKHVARFYEACKTGDLEQVEKFLEPSQGWMSRLSSKEMCVGMMWSISNNMTSVLSRLMQEEAVYCQKTSLASCLMCGCKRGHVECVRLLLGDERVPLEVTNKAGVTPGQITESEEIVKMIKFEQRRYQSQSL